jgi:hypothetical protein
MPRLPAGLQLPEAPCQAPKPTRVYMFGRCAAMCASRDALQGASGLAVPMRDSRKQAAAAAFAAAGGVAAV